MVWQGIVQQIGRDKLQRYRIMLFSLISIIGVVSLTLYAMYHCQLNAINRKDELVVGMCIEYRPFEFENQQGESEGFDVDLAREIGKRVGKKILFKNIGFDALILSLLKNEIDLIISAMAITKSRCERINMIPYHGKTMKKMVLLFWGDIPTGVASLKDLAAYHHIRHPKRKLIISVQAGTIQEGYLREVPNIEIRTLDMIIELLLDIQYNKSIAAMVPCDILAPIKNDFGDKVQALVVDLPKEHGGRGEGIGVCKENTDLYNQIKQVVKDLLKEGFIDQLIQKWFQNHRF